MDDTVAYVQITHVEPLVRSGIGSEDDFALHSNVRRFHFESRSVEADGKLDDVTKRGKRRVVLTSMGIC